MDSWVFFPFSIPFFPSLLILSVLSPCLSQSVDGNYTACSSKFNCGKLIAGYPFFGDDRPPSCGHPGLKLSCQNNDKALININKLTYQVLDIDEENQILSVAREDYLNSRLCGSELANTTLDSSLFEFDSGVGNITFFYGCLSLIAEALPLPTVCNKSGLVYAQPGDSWNPVCSDHVIVPTSVPIVMPVLDLLTVDKALNDGFQVKWKVDSEACRECSDSQGACGVDSSNQTVCFCPNQTSPLKRCTLPSPSATTGGNSGGIPVGLGVGVGGAGFIFILLGCWLFLVIRRRKRKVALSESKDISGPPSSKSLPTPTTNFSQSIPSYPSSKSDIEKGSTYFGVQVFSYTELEKATDNFDASKELGDGGFGVVYYGVLSDGRGVAVKRLYESSIKRVEQFMNEIEILARLRHKNLVTLYGCTSKHSRDLLLVYEYIPNGTVADHLLGKQTNSDLLTWPVRLSIALETAEALAYLHAFDVIHRDVKTNNILLDNNFHVKVADFGLSRLFPTNVTHVSTAPQGTPGYVDPEYYQCYHLTDKSDVYSFGVVLIELISSLPAVDTNRHRHDINLANMAINKIQNHALHELVDPCLGFEKDYVVRRMITSVVELAFRCLQQERDMRPSMEEVREILRRIQNENFGGKKTKVVDIGADDICLLKKSTPPLSPDSVVTDKWVSSSTTTSSF